MATTLSNSGKIIPLASYLPIAVGYQAGGAVGIPIFIGFGNGGPGFEILGNTIDFSLASGTVTNFAFSMPIDGTITGMTVTFSVVTPIRGIDGEAIVKCQIYSAPADSSTFSPIAETALNLAPSIANVEAGAVSSGKMEGLSVPVTAGTQLLFVATAFNTSPAAILQNITGFLTAGIAMS